MRYVSMPTEPVTAREWWEQADGSQYLARTVHEEDGKPVDTGLLDASGKKLFRVEDRLPIGFVRR